MFCFGLATFGSRGGYGRGERGEESMIFYFLFFVFVLMFCVGLIDGKCRKLILAEVRGSARFGLFEVLAVDWRCWCQFWFPASSRQPNRGWMVQSVFGGVF